MGNYRNFKLVIFSPSRAVVEFTEKSLEEQLAFFNKHVRPDKVYIESYRSDIFISVEQLKMVKNFFKHHGVEAAGAITTTCGDMGEPHKQRYYNTFCYTDEAMRAHLKEICERTASVFDEFIIDDFFFTSCTCDSCREAKGSRSWAEFRLELMAEVSKNLVIGPAKAVNPNCKITIKYPNWIESFQQTGYNPLGQRDLFDTVYTGTETRHAAQTHQHIPRYLSYSLMRWMENFAPGRNGGGWFDPYQCYPMDVYLEQGYLTVFSHPREVMLFCWPALYDTALVPPLGFQLQKLDALMGYTGGCVGLPAYHPCDSQGEDHLEDFLGMAGIPFEGVPYFPKDAPALFLTASAACDKDIMAKLEAYVANGGKAMVSSGFMLAMLGRGIEQMTSIRSLGRRATVSRYMVEEAGEYNVNFPQMPKPVTIPVLEYRTNATWPEAKGMAGAENFGVLMHDAYGKGELITLAVPDNFSEIKNYPPEVFSILRRLALPSLHMEGPSQIGLFAYDNNVFVLYPFVEDGVSPEKVSIHVAGEAKALTDIATAAKIPPLYSRNGETVFRLMTYPGKFVFYKVER
jgi:hypothetical protein